MGQARNTFINSCLSSMDAQQLKEPAHMRCVCMCMCMHVHIRARLGDRYIQFAPSCLSQAFLYLSSNILWVTLFSRLCFELALWSGSWQTHQQPSRKEFNEERSTNVLICSSQNSYLNPPLNHCNLVVFLSPSMKENNAIMETFVVVHLL